MAGKRMSGMSLSSFSKASPQTGKPVEQVKAKITAQPSPAPKESAQKRATKTKQSETLVTVNIKIAESQQEWLAKTSKQVRRNNDEAVAAVDRVYPQHLIGVAIDLLKDTDVNWSEVKNIDDLKEALGL